jgi:gamma-polyglutamate biosynthesis protein CapA
MKKVLVIVAVIFVGIILFVIFPRSSSRTYSRGSLFLPDIFETSGAKILFVGDMNFDRYIRQVANEKGEDYIFSCINDFLKDANLVVGNLEGPITDNNSVSIGTKPENPDNFIFTFPSTTAKLLGKNNIKIINLGNNHVNNFGQAGIDSTKSYLDKAGVNYFMGDKIYRENNMSFISYNEFSGDSVQKIAQKIKEEKTNGQTVFVYAHWGDEYLEVLERVKNVARLFAQSGADFIVGSHPHIILPSEKIGDTFVYYSLGNFIFDQYWNKEVSTGLVLELNIKNKNISIVEHKVSLNKDGKTCLEE